MKSVNPDDYVSGYLVMQGEWLKIIDDYLEDQIAGPIIAGENTIVISEPPKAEAQVIKSESYNKLSKEAKKVVQIVLNTPSELIGLVTTPKTQVIKPEKLRQFLRSTYPDGKVRRIYRELKKFTAKF